MERDWCNVRIKSHHYVIVKVKDNKLIVSAKDLSGKTIDSFEYTKPRGKQTMCS